MLCYSARKMISLERDDLLPAEKTSDLARHLDSCEDCRQYRDDLRLGSRILNATTPQVAENFNWKLQLKLGRALQEAAADGRDPWGEKQRGPAAWMRSFALSSLAGAAVVALLVIWIQPNLSGVDRAGQSPLAETRNGPATTVAAAERPIGLDRLPLTPLRGITQQNRAFGGLTVNQNARGGADTFLSQSPSFFNTGGQIDPAAISRLQMENAYLRNRLIRETDEINRLKALLLEHEIDLLDETGSRRE